MKIKILNIFLKTVLSLILIMPILGVLGVFPPPTPDMYNTKEAFDFIQVLMSVKYIMFLEAVVFVITIFCLWTYRVALASIMLLPVSFNILGFHLFLDGGLFTSGSIMGNILFVLNIYFLWYSRKELSVLLCKK